jgi:hypothetical protein
VLTGVVGALWATSPVRQTKAPATTPSDPAATTVPSADSHRRLVVSIVNAQQHSASASVEALASVDSVCSYAAVLAASLCVSSSPLRRLPFRRFMVFFKQTAGLSQETRHARARVHCAILCATAHLLSCCTFAVRLCCGWCESCTGTMCMQWLPVWGRFSCSA